MFLIRKLIPMIAPQMRAPQSGIFGWLAMKVMDKANPRSIQDGIKRLDISSEDVLVELGSGHGHSLRSITALQIVPKQIVCVEISPMFRKKLKEVEIELPEELRSKIEIRGDDAKDMKGFLQDSSVSKIFAMNVVYFLDPLADYLTELHRVLQKDGILFWGCKFHAVPKDSDEFVNTDEHVIVEAMKKAGFEVSSTFVELGEDRANYTALIGRKL